MIRSQLLWDSNNNGLLIHIKLWREDGEEICATWSELQTILRETLKDHLGSDGNDVDLLEVYPRSENEVNEVNIRHFFSFPDSLGDFMHVR